jgi:hypothetical protein
MASVGHEDQGLQARAPRPRLAHRPKSISATRFSTFKTAFKALLASPRRSRKADQFIQVVVETQIPLHTPVRLTRQIRARK